MIRRISLWFLPLTLFGCSEKTEYIKPKPPVKWAAYFAEAEEPELLNGYEIIVLDLEKHPNLAPLKLSGAKILAYISIGEIATYREYYETFANEPNFFIEENEAWGSFKVDIRNKKWQSFINDELIPKALAKGFDGVFLDTIDSAIDLEEKNRFIYSGMHQAAYKIIKSSRKSVSSPKIIMVNRAFGLLPEVANEIDIVLAESILVNANKSINSAGYLKIARRLNEIRKKNVNLQIFTLDYPDLKDKNVVSKVICTHLEQGFSPYLADKNLQSVSSLEEIYSSCLLFAENNL